MARQRCPWVLSIPRMASPTSGHTRTESGLTTCSPFRTTDWCWGMESSDTVCPECGYRLTNITATFPNPESGYMYWWCEGCNARYKQSATPCGPYGPLQRI